MSTLVVSNINDGTTTVPATYVTNGSAKAWVIANQQGTQAIRGSFNVSSLTDLTAGESRYTFTSGMADVNYCGHCTGGQDISGSGAFSALTGQRSTSYCDGASYNGSVAATDCASNQLSIQGDLA